MYVVTSMPLVSRTRATLRSAEFGFLGVCVNTRTQTPRFCGLLWSAGLLVLLSTASRPFRTSWLIVGTDTPLRLPVGRRLAPPARFSVFCDSGLRAEARHPIPSPIAVAAALATGERRANAPRRSRGISQEREACQPGCRPGALSWTRA